MCLYVIATSYQFFCIVSEYLDYIHAVYCTSHIALWLQLSKRETQANTHKWKLAFVVTICTFEVQKHHVL